MKTRDLFIFRISSMSPESLPLVRLLEYLEELTTLFGNKHHVHFMKVSRGSAAPAFFVDPQAEPKVRARLLAARSPNPPTELAQSITKLNKLLRDDNAFGELKAPGGAQIIQFPGKKEAVEEEITVSEAGSLEGQLVRLGGKDETAHATLEVEPGRWENFSLSRALARELAQHLYEGEIRVFGKGKWKRTMEGVWSLEGFVADRFESAGTSDLLQTMGRIASVQGDAWRQVEDPLEELKRLRGGH